MHSLPVCPWKGCVRPSCCWGGNLESNRQPEAKLQSVRSFPSAAETNKPVRLLLIPLLLKPVLGRVWVLTGVLALVRVKESDPLLKIDNPGWW